MDLGYRLSVGERDAGQQSQGQLGDVEVRLRHERRQLLQHGRQDVHGEAGAVVLDQRVQQGEAGQLERSLVLSKEGGEYRQTVVEDAAEVNLQWRRGHHDERLDSRQPRDLVLESVQEDWEAAGEVTLEAVSQVRHYLPHAGDGSLLDLLVNVLGLGEKSFSYKVQGCDRQNTYISSLCNRFDLTNFENVYDMKRDTDLQSYKATLVDVICVEREVESCRRTVQRPEDLDE